MSDLQCVVYVSSAVKALSEQGLEKLLLDARSFNSKVQVTGALLYHDGTFFQYFEGPPDSVTQVYSRIRASRTHHSIYELLSCPIEQRLFPQWLMGASNVPSSVILELARAEWRATANSLIDGSPTKNEGLALLAGYWKSVACAP